MKRVLSLPIWAVGLAIFSMLFGGANLLFSLKVGATAGQHVGSATVGFLLTAVLLPFIGLLTTVLFDGNYQEFFQRIGKIPGKFLILCCVLILGPVLAIPRSVDISYQLLQPFFSDLNFSFFSLVFLATAVIFTVKEEWILALLGYGVSPLLLLFLGIVFVAGFLYAPSTSTISVAAWPVFVANVKYGFSTLDLLATIFFGALLLSLFKESVKYAPRTQVTNFALRCLVAGTIGSLLLALVYGGLIYVGWAHAAALTSIDENLVFNVLAERLFGDWAWLAIAGAVITVCLSTTMALLVVAAHYLSVDVFRTRVGYILSLLLVMIISFCACYWDLHNLARFTYGPVALVLYPVVIVLTLCNLAYKVAGVRTVKIPVALTFFVSLGVCSYFMFWR